nr:translation initiation factor IF-2-like [Aegilops tauschii subsp. strangulata]
MRHTARTPATREHTATRPAASSRSGRRSRATLCLLFCPLLLLVATSRRRYNAGLQPSPMPRPAPARAPLPRPAPSAPGPVVPASPDRAPALLLCRCHVLAVRPTCAGPARCLASPAARLAGASASYAAPRPLANARAPCL